MSENSLNILMVIQVIVSVTLVGLVLLQNRSDGLGGMFGGAGGEVFRTKRGLEKVVYRLTIILSIALSILSLLIVKYSS